MARSIDEFLDPTEHSALNHTGIPGVGTSVGDGGLGDITITVNTTLTSGAKNYNSLVINSGVSLVAPTGEPAIILVKGNLTVTGTGAIHADGRGIFDGGAGSDGTDGVIGTGPSAVPNAGSAPTLASGVVAAGGGGGGGGSGATSGIGSENTGDGGAGGTGADAAGVGLLALAGSPLLSGGGTATGGAGFSGLGHGNPGSTATAVTSLVSTYRNVIANGLARSNMLWAMCGGQAGAGGGGGSGACANAGSTSVGATGGAGGVISSVTDLGAGSSGNTAADQTADGGGGGGGGGRGGGCLYIQVGGDVALGSGSRISARGGAGGTGGNGGDSLGGCGGGGGGGGGGLALLVYRGTLTDSGATVDATGGAGGSGGSVANGGNGGAGAAGATGIAALVQLV